MAGTALYVNLRIDVSVGDPLFLLLLWKKF